VPVGFQLAVAIGGVGARAPARLRRGGEPAKKIVTGKRPGSAPGGPARDAGRRLPSARRVALTRLVRGSVAFGSLDFRLGRALSRQALKSTSLESTGLGSAILGSGGANSAGRAASTGARDAARGSAPGRARTPSRPRCRTSATGWRPACRNSALATMALTAAKASRPHHQILRTMQQDAHQQTRARWRLPAQATFAPRRRRGMLSLSAIFLGTFLHLTGLLWGLRDRVAGVKRRDIAGGLLGLRRERQRQRDGHDGAFVELALHGPFRRHAGPTRLLTIDSPRPVAFVPPLIGLAGLEEGIADPLQNRRPAMPTPLSLTRSTSRDPSTPAGKPSTVPPRSVNFMAIGDEVSARSALNARGSPVISGKSSGRRG